QSQGVLCRGPWNIVISRHKAIGALVRCTPVIGTGTGNSEKTFQQTCLQIILFRLLSPLLAFLRGFAGIQAALRDDFTRAITARQIAFTGARADSLTLCVV